jgi:hypothetical protein
MLSPYRQTRNHRGVAVTDADEIKQLLKECTRAKLACAVHAIGDRANRNVLDAVAESGHISRRFRHRIEHCQIIAPADVDRFIELGVIASMQPSHATADIDLMHRYLGRRRYHSYRFRTLRRKGALLAFGSDAPIEPPNPLHGIYAAVAGRRPGKRTVFNKNQLLAIHDAIRGFTLGGAEAVGAQGIRGNLEVGKKADMVVLDRDITRLLEKDILSAAVVATYVNGRALFMAKEFAEINVEGDR